MPRINTKICNVLESTNSIFFDVDNTLVMWEVSKEDIQSNRRVIRVKDPYIDDLIIALLPHQTHINILKRNHAQGRIIVVWSAAGAIWAELIVKTLKLEKYVSLIMEKPSLYVDDTPIEKWGPKLIYLKDDFEGDKL